MCKLLSRRTCELARTCAGIGRSLHRCVFERREKVVVESRVLSVFPLHLICPPPTSPSPTHFLSPCPSPLCLSDSLSHSPARSTSCLSGGNPGITRRTIPVAEARCSRLLREKSCYSSTFSLLPSRLKSPFWGSG